MALPLFVLLAATALASGHRPPGGGRGTPVSVEARRGGSGWAGQGRPQEARPRVLGRSPPAVRLGLEVLPPPFPVDLPSLPPLPYPLSGGEVAAWPSGIFGLASAATAGRGRGIFEGAFGLRSPLRVVAVGGAGEVEAGRVGAGAQMGAPAGQERPSPLFQSELAQMDVRLRGRGEFGGNWTRFQPCEAGLQRSCNPGLFPELKPDLQFGILVGGTVADRIHVDVDYDQAREFSATNNVNIYYEGKEDEIIRRLEVGDVTLRFPESRFLTQGIPAGNFGLRALTTFGPLDVQTVWAQQNGDISSREFQLSGVGGREAFIQEDTLVLDDADYVQGQFFFLLDPRLLAGYPYVDVLSLDPSVAPLSEAPGPEPVQLYRFENDPVTRQQVEGYIQAEAVAGQDGDTVRASGWFRYLQPGVDYLLHPSGLWVALRRPLRQDEMLAVTYITTAGDTIGDYNPERIHNAGGQPRLRLLKAAGPEHVPGSPTWEREMHQVYRISSSDYVEAGSVALTLSLGELSAGRTFKRRPDGEEITLLKLMGLDEEAPVDRLDPTFVYRPAEDFFQDQPPVSGTFIVFPTLRPFEAPPPLPSLGLTAEETRQILGADANPIIYESTDPVQRENGGIYRLTMPFRIRSEGVISTFSLGALGIRDGSERIYFGDRLLIEGEDYFIDYDVGQVTLRDPEALFATDPQGRIRATWEQKALFQIAPTSIFGVNARSDLGDRGTLHLLGLYQQERTLQNRPQLGMEPASSLMGGLNGDLTFGASWLDRAAQGLPGVGSESPSTLRVNGELAVSVPNPNTVGDVYLDDFDASDALPLSLLSQDWHLGSAPEDRDGVDGILPPAANAVTAAGLVWQHTWILQGPGGDSLGIFQGFFPRRDIDQQINIAGTETRQTGMRLTFGGTAGGEPAPGEVSWRSVTTSLSNTGTDLTRTDYLEFYAAGGEGLTLILDLGRVSEDAFFVDPQGNTNGIRPSTGESWGLGILDQEADPRKGEIWNDVLDERGLWAETCQGGRGKIYPLGDPDANCTRGNGRNDTEDLDGDGNLYLGDRVYRYVVALDGSSPYLVRTTEETGTSFQLYRIPLQGPEAINVGGRVTEADWRAVKDLRITVAGPSNQGVRLTRLRLLGSRWVKRAQDGVLTGLWGEVQGTGGRVEVGPVSVLTEGAAYQPPPGVLDELDNPSLAYGGGGVEFNEKSLSIQARELAPGERAEVYSRFPQRPRNFLTYRQARIWILGRDGDWGPEGVQFFLKVGTDSENFYLFRIRRDAPAAGADITPSDWLPEVTVDFQQWLTLRREAEEELIRNPPEPGGPPVEIWSADSTYAVVLKDRARAPNLAAVRELSLGIWNPGPGPAQATVWLDELRLARSVKDPGYAGYLNVDLQAPGLLRTSVSYSGRGPFFRQLSGDPTYLNDETLSVSSNLELGRVVPEEWGVSVPVTFAYSRVAQDPTFLAQSDVRADRLPDLRRPGFSEVRAEVGLRKLTPVGNRVLDPVLQGLSFRAGVSRDRLSTTTLASRASGLDARADYFQEPDVRDFALIPGFAEGVVRAVLPRGLEASLLGTRLRWTPELIRVGTLFSRRSRKSFRFEQILRLAGDTAVVPTLAPERTLEATAQVAMRPFPQLTAAVTFFSVRDLLSPAKTIPDPRVQALIREQRRSVGPLDLGWETRRNLQTRVGYTPSLASWMRTDFSVTTDYASDRNPALVEGILIGGDTVLVLERNANGGRSTAASVSVDPGDMARAWVGYGAEQDTAAEGALVRVMGAIDPVFISRQGGLSARYFRAPVDPGAGFQLGLEDQDGFRFLGEDTASVVSGRTNWTGGSGVRLPLGFHVSGNYSDSRIQIQHLRSGREIRNRSWPDLRVTVPALPLPEVVDRSLETLSVTSGFRRVRLEATFGGRGFQKRVSVERQVPVELAAAWSGGLNTRYRGSVARGDGVDPTGTTKTRRQSHAFTLSALLAEPPLLASRLDGPLQVSLGYQYSSELTCRVPVGLGNCIPFVDLLNRNVNLTLGTIISPLEVGLHLNYTSRQSFVGRHDGSTQFQLGVFGQFLFDSGTFVPPSISGTPGGS